MIERTVRIGACTNVGKVRELNEDAFGTPDAFQIDGEQQKQRGTLVAVADGMGGHAAGEVASQIAIETLFATYYFGNAPEPGKALTASFAAANQQVYAIASSESAHGNMGTTLVAAVVKGASLWVANVGDSRTYLVRGKTIRQITRDHSWVAEQVEARALSTEEAQQHAYKNVITRAIGNHSEVETDLFRARLKANDVIVLCSDGLQKVEPPEIQSVVRVTADPDQAARQLIALANARGGADNITAVVVQVPYVPSAWFSLFGTLGVTPTTLR